MFMSNFQDLIGKRFNNLTVIKRVANNKHGGIMWLCKCDCGKEMITRGRSLKINHTQSCGCLKSKKCKTLIHFKRPYEWIYNSLVNSIKKRNYSIDFSYTDFLEFTKINKCYYCGDNIIWNTHRKKDGSTPSRYNLDRKDNDKGYTKDNCVVCCKKCNYMKVKLNESEYIHQCKKITEYQSIK